MFEKQTKQLDRQFAFILFTFCLLISFSKPNTEVYSFDQNQSEVRTTELNLPSDESIAVPVQVHFAKPEKE